VKKPDFALLLALLPFSLLGAVPVPAAAAAPIFVTPDPAPGAEDPGDRPMPWPDGADTQPKPGGSPLDRWTAQGEAGRARAAALVGRYWLEVVPQNPQENCAKAIEWYLKADKLGSNEAAGWLGHLYRRLDCPQRDLKVAAQWLRKAVPLATYGAATDLADLYSAADSAERDDTLAYAYARVAAEFEANLSGATPATERVAILGQPLDTRQRKTGDEFAEKLLADVRQRRAAMTAAPREEKLKPAASGAGWNVGLSAYDDLRECAANTSANCRGVRRQAYYDVSNKGDEYLRCKFELDSTDYVLGTKTTLARESIVAPRATRRLLAGRIGELSGGKDLRVTCTPIDGLAASVTAGQCKATATGVPSVDDFYPAGAKRRGEEGSVKVYVFLDKQEGQPVVAELWGSSGFPELDLAGVRMATYMAFRSDCQYGYLPFAITFRLQD
jgi:hypothetical protein